MSESQTDASSQRPAAPEPQDSPEPGQVSVDLSCDGTVNLAMQQNDVPVIQALRIVNGGDRPAEGLVVRIASDPEFADLLEKRLDLLAPHSSYDFGHVDLPLKPSFLIQLTERVTGRLRVEVQHGERVVASTSAPLAVLARDEWNGLGSLPEIIAAFVRPNEPHVDGVLREAGEILGGWTGDSALTGYQTGSREHVLRTAAAVLEALGRRGVQYAALPASFEAVGQKVRSPERIFASGLGNCLDLSVLVASLFEQASLHPLIVFRNGHAVAGVWLDDECFRECTILEPLALRKRIELGEISLFEATAVTSTPRPDFAEITRLGAEILGNPEDFVCAVDIRRARHSRILPLSFSADAAQPNRSRTPAGAMGKSSPTGDGAPELSSVLVEKRDATPGEKPSARGVGRLEEWKRKLLDLTLHNALLNFRESSKTVSLLVTNLAALEDGLAQGREFEIGPAPAELTGEGEVRDGRLHRQRTGVDPMTALLTEEMAAGRLRSRLNEKELGGRLLKVFREGQVSLEEGGANTLFLALGFLVWYESDSSQQERRAPLILIPVDIERASIRSGFRLRRRDDEARVNVTLLERLKQDFGIAVDQVDPIPEDEHGIDVAGVLAIFRRAVRDMPRWQVIEEAFVGLFSFAKFLMWRDLQDRSEDLLKNPLVALLVGVDGRPVLQGGSLPDPAELDRVLRPHDVFCPSGVDSFQLAAVHAAAQGSSFVLQGPPGTGKSQTITNLIAHVLAQGKTVLFVSEKTAALNVVKSRLDRCGLGPFCLEVHSSKTQKRHVVSQLEEALNFASMREPEDWEREATRLESLRRELNAYVEALHKVRPLGLSVYRALCRLCALRSIQPARMNWKSIGALQREDFERQRDSVERLAAQAIRTGAIAASAWQGCRLRAWNRQTQNRVDDALRKLEDAAGQLKNRLQKTGEFFGVASSTWSDQSIRFLRELAELFLSGRLPSASMLDVEDWDSLEAPLGQFVETGRRYHEVQASVLARCNDLIFDLDLEALLRRMRKAQALWAPLRWLRRFSIRRTLARLSPDGKTPGEAECLETLSDAIETLRLQRELTDIESRLTPVLVLERPKSAEAWSLMLDEMDFSRHLFRLARKLGAGDAEKTTRYVRRWAEALTVHREGLAEGGLARSTLTAFTAASEEFLEARAQVEESQEADPAELWKTDAGLVGLDDVLRKTRAMQEGGSTLRDWCQWRAVRQEALDLGLGVFAEACESGNTPVELLVDTFERSFYEQWVDAVMADEPALKGFSRVQADLRLKRFRETDDRYTELAKDLICARLSAAIPRADGQASPNSGIGILRREVRKQRAHMPIRKLFQNIVHVLPRIKPCFLMSPMSVAQYLDPSHPPFDLVVFDEASQIPIWDAVGTIARGSSAVVVGDPRQLPPTSFFSRADDGEGFADETTIEDLESILDDCIAAGLPMHQLKWHYRSRHETLIAFSNYHYYDNGLLTFPDREITQAVKLRPVPEGVYDKGRSRTNKAEAEAIVAEIVERLRDPSRNSHSLGVVTFSVPQRDLIEDLLEKERLEDGSLERFFCQEASEPLFVKNLENVQGDERDVILFSVCYGPDQTGRVAMNFGPLNREGGERRLNVAITRARHEVLVFSTLRADQIDLSRTRARGARDLKSFLEYAERGPAVLGTTSVADPSADFDSPFESEVCRSLEERGHRVHLQVGCSGYRIDLGVVDPDYPGRYLLGIECDGATYHSAKTARDRDRLREMVLEDLGWTIHRIWSRDWWEDPDTVLQEVEKAIEKAKRKARATSHGPSVKPPVQASVNTAPPPPGHGETETAEEPETGKPGHVQEEASAPPVFAAKFKTLSPSQASPTMTTRKTPAIEPARETGGSKHEPGPQALDPGDSRLRPYRVYTWSGKPGEADAFYEPQSEPAIRRQITSILATEAPIALPLLARRVLLHWKLAKATDRVVDRLKGLLEKMQCQFSTGCHGSVFVWTAGQTPAPMGFFRTPVEGDGDTQRNASEIPPEEIAVAARHVVNQQVSLPPADLVRETARLLGFQRTGQKVEQAMQAGVKRMLKAGWAREEDGLIVEHRG